MKVWWLGNEGLVAWEGGSGGVGMRVWRPGNEGDMT